MANKAFEALMESMNAQLQILKNNGYAIYDRENPDYFISAIKYNRETDQLEFETEKEFEEVEEEE